MSRPNPVGLIIIFAVVLALSAGLSWIVGGVTVTRYEGDAYHLLDVLTRMRMGQMPHLDFVTPIGGLAFWPFLPGLNAGLGDGLAFLSGQILVALGVFPFLIWAAATRLSSQVASLFIAMAALTVTALAYGGADAHVSVSMHYNRWAWVIAWIAILVAAMPAARNHRVVDGIVLGCAFIALLLIKVTYVVSLGPALLLILLIRRQFWTISVATVVAICLAIAVTLALGQDYWQAYADILRATADNLTRPYPGLNWPDLMTGPAFVAATAVVLAAFVILRNEDAGPTALGILLLYPAFVYITFQNFGNDPLWLFPLAMILFSRPAARALTAAGFVALALSAPPLVTMAMSPVRHAMNAGLETDPLVPRVPYPRGSIYAARIRAETVNGQVALDTPKHGLAHLSERVARPNRTSFKGNALPDCQLSVGYPAWFSAIEAGLEEVGLDRESRLFVADVLPSQWLFGNRPPLDMGAPWSYGALDGIDDATHVLVPRCPIQQVAQTALLRALEDEGPDLNRTATSPLFYLYEIAR